MRSVLATYFVATLVLWAQIVGAQAGYCGPWQRPGARFNVSSFAGKGFSGTVLPLTNATSGLTTMTTWGLSFCTAATQLGALPPSSSADGGPMYAGIYTTRGVPMFLFNNLLLTTPHPTNPSGVASTDRSDSPLRFYYSTPESDSTPFNAQLEVNVYCGNSYRFVQAPRKPEPTLQLRSSTNYIILHLESYYACPEFTPCGFRPTVDGKQSPSGHTPQDLCTQCHAGEKALPSDSCAYCPSTKTCIDMDSAHEGKSLFGATCSVEVISKSNASYMGPSPCSCRYYSGSCTECVLAPVQNCGYCTTSGFPSVCMETRQVGGSSLQPPSSCSNNVAEPQSWYHVDKYPESFATCSSLPNGGRGSGVTVNCARYSNCLSCSQGESSRCGWCSSTKTCLQGSDNGADSSSNSGSSSESCTLFDGNWFWTPESCL